MADAVVEFILGNLKEYCSHFIDTHSGGEEVVRWIKYELETLIPQLERAPDPDGRLRYLIGKAEVLTDTYTKRVTQRNAGGYLSQFNSIGILFITKDLHEIRDKISRARERFSHDIKRHGSAEQQQGAERDVPSYLRRFIHYFVLFPPKFEVPARRIIALWVAEGSVHTKKHDNQSAEQIAEGYLHELSELRLVQVIKNRSGKVKSCSIDPGRRDELIRNAADGGTRWLVDSNGSSGDFFIQIDGDQTTTKSVRNYKDVASFLSFNKQEGSKPGEDIGDFLRRCISARCFTWLNVLDLEKVFRPQLPDTLGELIALKYLGLRWTYLEQLPSSVQRLFNLQVLDVKHTYISILPRSIWRMQYLRHLYLSEAYRTRFPDPQSTVALTSLQTLWGTFVDEDTRLSNGLDTSLNIRKLGLSCRWRDSKTGEDGEMWKQLRAIDKWISNLKYLESLRLKSRDRSGKAAPLHLTSLEENTNLSTVYLLGKLDPLILCELPVSLADVTLSGSELNVDPMGFLGVLPNLLILRLLGESVECSKIHCRKRGFRRLKFLYIWKLEKLLELEAEEESLPCLDELEIRSCHNLKQLPHRLRKLPNLEITLTSMKPDFVRREGSIYAEVEHVPKDDQYILKNKLIVEQEPQDLISPCFMGNPHYISRNNTGSIF